MRRLTANPPSGTWSDADIHDAAVDRHERDMHAKKQSAPGSISKSIKPQAHAWKGTEVCKKIRVWMKDTSARTEMENGQLGMEGDRHGQKNGTKRRRVRERLQNELAGSSSDEDGGGTGPRPPPGARGLDGLAASTAQLGTAMATGLGQLAGAFAGRGGSGTYSALSAESLKFCASVDGGAAMAGVRAQLILLAELEAKNRVGLMQQQLRELQQQQQMGEQQQQQQQQAPTNAHNRSPSPLAAPARTSTPRSKSRDDTPTQTPSPKAKQADSEDTEQLFDSQGDTTCM